MVETLPYPIFGPEEIGIFQEIIHDLCQERQIPRQMIYGACEELEILLGGIYEKNGPYLIELKNSFKINCASSIETKDEFLETNFDGDAWKFSLNFLEISREEAKRFYHRQTARQKSAHVKILNQSLKRKNEEIEKVLESKKYLLSFLAHELRNPITSIINSVELMRMEPSSIKEFGIDKMLESASKDMKRLVDEVLDMAKMENDSMAYEMVETTVKTICEDFNVYGESLVLGKGLSWRCNGLENLKEECILVDAFRLRQVLSNILSNAVKFTTEGSIEFSVKLKSGKAFLSIKDTGRGIKEEYKESLFQEFTQESAKISRQFGGTGLGMTICFRLVKDMKGEITFDSKEGEGTTFHVSFPLIT